MQTIQTLILCFRRASPGFAVATGLSRVCMPSCVSYISEAVLERSVTAVAVLSHSAVDRHKQAHPNANTRTRVLLTKFLSLCTSDLSSVWCQWYIQHLNSCCHSMCPSSFFVSFIFILFFCLSVQLSDFYFLFFCSQWLTEFIWSFD